MAKTAVITQSNYMPWRGWFEMLAQSDIWIVYDTVQFTKRDWRNRNIIRVNDGPQWLTIPVSSKGKYTQLICETEVSESEWFTVHKRKLLSTYCKFPYIADLTSLLNQIDPLVVESIFLTDINTHIASVILKYLGVSIEIVDARKFQVTGNASERLVQLCQHVNADNYLTGPAARDYMETDLFIHSGIEVKWMDYSKLPTDIHGQAESGEYSIVDLIAREGALSVRKYIPSCSNYKNS